MACFFVFQAIEFGEQAVVHVDVGSQFAFVHVDLVGVDGFFWRRVVPGKIEGG